MNKIIKRTLPLIVLALVACGKEQQTMTGKYSSMQSCIEGTKRHTGGNLNIITDKPDQVSGFLANGKGFGCNVRETGSQGTYVEGWFGID